MKPAFLTFTGIDAGTDLARVESLSNTYPIEWGVLFSPDRQGQEPRYPAMSVIDNFRDLDVRKSAHLCGDYSKMVMRATLSLSTLPASNECRSTAASPMPRRLPALQPIPCSWASCRPENSNFPKTRALPSSSTGLAALAGSPKNGPGIQAIALWAMLAASRRKTSTRFSRLSIPLDPTGSTWRAASAPMTCSTSTSARPLPRRSMDDGRT